MKPYPHHYTVSALAGPEGEVLLSGDGLEAIRSAPPVEFDGPGDRWSPETLLVGAMADCLVLTFRAVARAGKLPWTSLECEVEALLERVDGTTRFTRFDVVAQLTVPAGTDEDAALRALQKAEHGCLISNSLSGRRMLTASVDVLGG